MRFSLLFVFIVTIAWGCGGVDQSSTKNHDRKTVLVTGATGTQGGAVARELIERGYIVRGLTRNTESARAQAMSNLGAEMIRGDFDDAASLASAMNGVYGVFVVTNFWEHGYDTEVQHGKQLADAALQAKVQHLVFTSVAGADANSGIPHFESKGEVESYLRNSGVNFSIVRPVEFMDNVHYDREDILSGKFSDPRDPGKSHQWIAASDIGFFVGEAFDNPDDWIGRTLEIAGDELTIGDFIDVLSTTFGIEVKQQQLTWNAYQEQNGAEMTGMMRWFNDSGYEADIDALRSEYPDLLTYQEYLEGEDWN